MKQDFNKQYIYIWNEMLLLPLKINWCIRNISNFKVSHRAHFSTDLWHIPHRWIRMWRARDIRSKHKMKLKWVFTWNGAYNGISWNQTAWISRWRCHWVDSQNCSIVESAQSSVEWGCWSLDVDLRDSHFI